MPIIYNSCSIIPAPLVTITQDKIRNEAGDIISRLYRIVLNGTIVAYKGSPQSGTLAGASWGGPNDQFWIDTGYPDDETPSSIQRLKNILRKIEALKALFKDEGKLLEIQPLDGSTPMSCNPRVKSMNFDEGLWFDVCKYQIELEADTFYGVIDDDADDKILESSETWEIQFGETLDTYRLTHTISAKGKKTYDVGGTPTAAWTNARAWVSQRIGYDASTIGNFLVTPVAGKTAYNREVSETLGELTGDYQYVENWVLSANPYIEDYTVNIRTNLQDSNLTVVTIEGQINGLAEDPTVAGQGAIRYAEADEYWTTVQSLLLTRAQTYSGATLNIRPMSTAVGKNPVTGSINYTYEYNTRPSNCIADALTESITVVENYKADIYARQTILGRTNRGPVLQNINTKTARSRELSIAATFEPNDTCVVSVGLAAKPNTDDIVADVRPTGSLVFVDADSETWDWKVGSYQRRVAWTWEE